MSESPANRAAKAELRRRNLACRDALDPGRRAADSKAVADLAISPIVARRPERVAGYWPIRSECDPRPLLEQLADAGIALALPIVVDKLVVFRHWKLGDRLVAAGFGTRGPDADAAVVIPDLIVLPLAGFDRRGRRIGYGQGHYDRAVAALRREGHDPLLVGIGFAIQEIGTVPDEPHDIALDLVVTESEVIAVDR